MNGYCLQMSLVEKRVQIKWEMPTKVSPTTKQTKEGKPFI